MHTMPEEMPTVEYTLDQAADLLRGWLKKYQDAEPGAWEELETKTEGFLILHGLADHGVVSKNTKRRVAAEVEGQQETRAGVGGGRHRKDDGWRDRVFA